MRPVPHVALLTVAATVALHPRRRGRRLARRPITASRLYPRSTSPATPAADLLGDYFAVNMALPAAHSPFDGTANLCLSIGHRGRVLVPVGRADQVPERASR